MEEQDKEYEVSNSLDEKKKNIIKIVICVIVLIITIIVGIVTL